tara:strand:+ start:930 stop:1550 length:621 start_codon:yes stop_codon:yes gene_type:complete
MPEFKAHNLWPIPIYESEIPVKQEWKDAVINLEYDRTHVNNSDISKDRYILNYFPDLKEEIEKHCEIFVRKYLSVKNNAKFYLQNSWSNIHFPGEFSQIHHHGNSLISGVYYPIFPKNSGNISFHHRDSTATNLFPQSLMVEYDEDNHLNAGMYYIEIKEGTIVLFPSHLEHKVQENKSNKKRYSIAFNFYVRGKFGKEEYILEIK